MNKAVIYISGTTNETVNNMLVLKLTEYPVDKKKIKWINL